MVNIRLVYDKGYKWFNNNDIFVKGYIFTPDNQLFQGEQLIDYFSSVGSFDDFQTKLRQANGLFAVVIRNKNSLWAAIDHARAFPLFYYQKKDLFEITDNPDELKSDNIPMSIEEDNAAMMCCSGFVPGDKTLLKDVFQLRAGESLCYENNTLRKEFHACFLTEVFSTKTREELKEELKSILDNVGKRMVKFLGDKPVAVPLSGGYDSRLVAYLLKKNNHPHVLCFTYGLPANTEINNAKRTAENLGFNWHFINYENHYNKSLIQDADFIKYANFSACYCSKFFTQDYYATRELMELENIPGNTVFIPGHSGAIAGHLLKEKMMEPDFSFTDCVLNDIFSLVYPRRKDLKIIRKEINILNNYDKKYPSYLFYENWRFQETTVKFGINASKLWDFLGYEFALPLWDKELFNFFVHVAPEHKYNKNLYVETLSELFKEFNIYFSEKELFPTDKLARKVAFRSKLKSQFPFLRRFRNIWKNDITGSQHYARPFINELKDWGKYRKMLSVNGIFSTWYVESVRKSLTLKSSK